jgi:predicted membrane-bound spermidine synthase
MVRIGISGKRIRFEVEGVDQMWALRSLLEFPLSHIRGVSVDPEAARGWWHGIKLWGSNIPGILTAGTFYQNGRVVFYDVHDPERTLVIELDHEHYDRLIVEVDDPEKEKVKIDQAIHGAAGKKKKAP